MVTGRYRIRLGLVVLGLVLTAGFFTILERRFIEGGLYPHYASFRTDPMGTSVFYETLDRLGDYSVTRNLKPLHRLKGLDGESVILLLGYPRGELELLRAPGDSELLRAVEAGARLVITLNPELVPEMFKPSVPEPAEEWLEERRRIREEQLRRTSGEEKEKGSPDGGAGKEALEVAEEELERLEEEMPEQVGPLFTTRTGFDFSIPEGFERPAEGWKLTAGASLSPGGVPLELPFWRSQYRAEIRDPAWKAAALVGKKPVVIERPWGLGRIVVTTDSYFVSNESLHFEAGAEFLLWLLGDKRKVVFDETIHGSVESGGAMKLIRRYRAHGVFFGLFVCFILWAWRSASTLVPGYAGSETGPGSAGGQVAAEETAAGFIRLLRRSVPPSMLMLQCVKVWKESLITEPPPDTIRQIEKFVAAHGGDPKRHGIVETYLAISGLLRKR